MRIIVLWLIPLSCLAQDLPYGWRLADQDELSGRLQADTQFTTDFNGDAVDDTAYAVKSTEFTGEGLLVHLSSEQGHQWHTLERIHWGPEYPQVRLTMGIGLAEAGNYITACGQGQWQCDEYETAEFGIEFPGIWYYRTGGHKSLFYWNTDKQKFDKQWISN